MSPKLPHNQLQWRKSRRSAQQGACVELASQRGRVFVRDSKDPDGPVLAFGRDAFAAVVRRIRDDELGDEKGVSDAGTVRCGAGGVWFHRPAPASAAPDA